MHTLHQKYWGTKGKKREKKGKKRSIRHNNFSEQKNDVLKNSFFLCTKLEIYQYLKLLKFIY